MDWKVKLLILLALSLNSIPSLGVKGRVTSRLTTNNTKCESKLFEAQWFSTVGGSAMPLADPLAGATFDERSSRIRDRNRSLPWLFGERNEFHFERHDGPRVWSAGSLNSEFILGNYLKTPDRRFRDLDYLLFLRALFNGVLGRVDGLDRPAWTSGKQVAFALHSEHADHFDGAYWAINGAQFEKYRDQLPERLRNLPEKYFGLISRNYQDRMGMETKDVDRLISISRQLLSRSILLLKTRESFLHFGTIDKAQQESVKPFTVEAGLILTWAVDPSQRLPMEIFNNESYQRPERNSAEIGRFVVDRGVTRDLSLREMQAAATMLVGIGIREAKCEADLPRAKLFIAQGMREELRRESNWQQQPELILSGDPEILTNITIDDPMKAPLYEFNYRQSMLLNWLQSELGLRLW